jgi:hypothetical protein
MTTRTILARFLMFTLLIQCRPLANGHALAAGLLEDLRISEIMYNPVQGDDYEFIELINAGSTTLDLTGVQFTAGITFTFGANQLPSGERIIVVKNLDALKTIHNLEGVRVANPLTFGGRLDNGGEKLTLADAQGTVIVSVDYDDSGAWPGRADGFGSSLEVLDARGDSNDPDNWRPSAEFNGSPGRAGTGPVRTVVINEVLANSDLPLEDAIELFNSTGRPIDLSGWFLSDSRSQLDKFRIPNQTVLPASGYIVFYEFQFNTGNPRVPFSLNSALGDEVYLTAADANGNLMRFVDTIQFGATENGISLGRFPNGTGDLVAMNRLTFGSNVGANDPPDRNSEFRTGQGAPNSEPKVGPLVISQIMFHPANGGDEFLELRNITSTALLLYDPNFPTNTWRIADAIEFSFPGGISVPAQASILVVPIDPATFRSKYSIASDVQIFGPYTGALNNDGETIELLKPAAPITTPPDAGLVPFILVERIRYDDESPWPAGASETGQPLRRINLAGFGNDPSNWTTQEPVDDSDGDGMPDLWEYTHGLDPRLNDAQADNDGDGLTNLQEFHAGTDPLELASVLKFTAVSFLAGAVQLQFAVAAGKSYSVQFRDALADGQWNKLLDLAEQESSGTIEVLDAQPVSSNRYYRLVTPAQP